MISWVIFAILVFIGIVVIKMNHMKHRYFIVLLVLLALFLYGTFSVVNSVNKLDFSTTKGVYGGMKVYFGWLAHGFRNLRALTGNAVNMNWTTTNGTFFNKTEINAPKT